MATYDPPQPAQVPPPQYVPPATPPSTVRWRNLQHLSTVLTTAFVLNALAAAVGIVFLAQRLSIFSEFEDGGGAFDLARRDEAAANNVQSIAITMVVLLLVTLILFIIWMWRAAKNNEALGRTHPRFGPGWSIGGWFIPFANLVIPVLIMQDLWRGSDPSIPRGDTRWKIVDRSALVGWWWGLLVGSRIAVGFFNGVSNDERFTISELRSDVSLSIVSAALSIVAAVLAILVVRSITTRQMETLRVQNEQWGQPSGGEAPAI